MVSSPATEEAVPRTASQWVVFVCGERTFGLPLERTREILPPRAMTRLPGCGPEVCGLVGIRGRVLTVFDFGVIVGGEASSRKTDYRLLVLIVKGRRVAVVVDEIVAVSRDAGELTPLSADAVPGPFTHEDLAGTGQLGELPFLALDADRVVGRLLT